MDCKYFLSGIANISDAELEVLGLPGTQRIVK